VQILATPLFQDVLQMRNLLAVEPLEFNQLGLGNPNCLGARIDASVPAKNFGYYLFPRIGCVVLLSSFSLF